MFTKILVAVDGTPTSNRGLGAAAVLAKEQGATLYVLHVIDELGTIVAVGPAMSGDYVEAMLENLRRSGRKIVANAEKTASRTGASVRAEMVTSRGQPVASTILRYAKRVRADLIVLGTHGRRGIGRLVMGSDAESVVRESPVPVLLVRSPERARPRTRRAQPARTPAKRRSASAPMPVMPGL